MEIKQYTDEEIIDAILKGGEELEKTMSYFYRVEAYQSSICQLLIKDKASPEEAEDIFQEALCQMILNIKNGRFQGKSNIKTYLTSICRNLWYTKARRSQKHQQIIQDGNFENEEEKSPAQQLIEKDIETHLYAVLAQIDEKCQEVLGLWALNYSMQEIADSLGYKSANMASRKKYKCLQRLTLAFKNQPIITKEIFGRL